LNSAGLAIGWLLALIAAIRIAAAFGLWFAGR